MTQCSASCCTMRADLISVLVLYFMVLADAITQNDLFSNGRGLDNQLPPGDDNTSEEIFLKVPITFYETTYESIFVNTNGLLSFKTDIPVFLNMELPLDYPVIAPFYTNVDTRKSGIVFFRETQDAYSLYKATEDIQNCFGNPNSFEPKSVFIATWSHVGYHSLGADKTNTFQVVIISNGTESFVEFLYPEDGIQWIQATTKIAGISDARAQAGFVGEDSRYLILKHSGKNSVKSITSFTNCGEAGKFMFRVGNIYDNIEEPSLSASFNVANEMPKSCAQGGSQQCHIKAHCEDHENGFCCVCIPGYYGNGKSCVKSNAPLRINGDVSGVINGELIENMNLQAYVVVSDGRTYTALSNTPDRFGYDMQTLSILGGVIGWLFAKPSGNAKNGYQLTGGVFNHTTEILFPDTREKVIIHQQYQGLDLFDQLKMKAEIKGSIPKIPYGTKLDIDDYSEQYTISRPGLILSQASRAYEDRATLKKYPFTIEQKISYDSCLYAPQEESSMHPVTLEVGKNFLGYESRERIVRYGMSNRIVPFGQEDPCIKGRETCKARSSCVVEEDYFKCVCDPGFQQIYIEGEEMCIDTNECTAGTHNCDINAICVNREGSFSCHCNEGYEGNGNECHEISLCSRTRCDHNAHCYISRDQPYCECNEGYTGDGYRCWRLEEGCDVLNNCSPYAICSETEQYGPSACRCLPGYIGDGYTCTRREIPVQITTEPYRVKENTYSPSVENEESTYPPPQENDSSTYLSSSENGEYPPIDENLDTGYPSSAEHQDPRYPYPRNEDPRYPSSGGNEDPRYHSSSGNEDPRYSSSGGNEDPRYPSSSGNEDPRYPSSSGNEDPRYPSSSGNEDPRYPSSNGNEDPRYPSSSGNEDPRYPSSAGNEDPRYPTSAESEGQTYPPESNSVIHSTCFDTHCECPSYYHLNNSDGLCYKIDPYDLLSYPLPICFNSMKCSCPRSFIYNSEKHICKPDPAFIHDIKGVSNKYMPCNVVNRCHPYAQCVYIPATNNFQCKCTGGFEGDGIDCVAVEQSCENDDICDPHASCSYDPAVSKKICVCNAGYQGDGHFCSSVGCRTSEDCEENAECKYSEEIHLTRRVCLCKEGYTRDYNDACIPDNDCNGATCAEHATCYWDQELGTNYCQCNEGFHGDGIEYCTVLEIGCDTLRNCDPNANCSLFIDENKYKCVCNLGFYGDGETCSAEITCEHDLFLCSPQATCKKGVSGFECICNPGFIGNGTFCKMIPKKETNFLLLNQGMATLRVPFEPSHLNPGRPIQISYYQIAVGLDVDCQDGRVYWSDISGKIIKSSNYDGTMIENFLTEDIISPEGLSIDWVSRNIFWTDSRKDTVEVANLDTKIRKVLINTDLVDPRGIAVHPYKGKIFWSDWNRKSPKIEWANMDGSNREIFLGSPSVTLPNSLAIDWDTDELCYADAGTKTIECVHIDTLEKRTAASNLSYPFSLAITSTHYYWTDWISQKVERLDKMTNIRQVPIDVPLGGSGNKLYGMSAVSDGCRAFSNLCQFDNGQCPKTHLCLLNGKGGRTCACGKVTSGRQLCNE